MYCHECGSKNEDDATFCTSCGAYFGKESHSQPTYQRPKPPKSHRNAGIALSIVILLLMAGFFGSVYLFNFNANPFVADEYVLYGDGAIGSGIITVVNDPSDADPYDGLSTVTLTFEKSMSMSSWGILPLDQSLYYVDEYTLPPSSEFYYYDERGYEVPDGATFSEDGRSMTCTLIPGHYSVSVSTFFKNYIGSFVVGGEVIRNYEWTYEILEGPFDEDTVYPEYSFELDLKFQYSQCVSGIEYDGPRGYVRFDQLGSVFKTFIEDGSAVTEDLQYQLRSLYLDQIPLPYRDDDHYYASFILTFVQKAISYYPEDLSEEDMPGSLMGSDKRIYGLEEYWAFPTETIVQGAGDCEDTSFLCAALFKAAGFDTALGILPGHVIAGIHFENSSSSLIYPYYDATYPKEYLITETIYDSDSNTTKTYYGCETTASDQHILGYTNLKSTVEDDEESEVMLKEWVPPGTYSTVPKTYGFYPV